MCSRAFKIIEYKEIDMILTSKEALKMLENARGKKKCDRMDRTLNMCSEILLEKLQKF